MNELKSMTTGQKLIAKDPYIIREDGKPRFTIGKEYIAEPLEGFRLFKVVTNLGETYHFGYHELETYFKDASQPEPMPAPSFGTWYSIETAPKDGTEILVLDYAGNQSVAKWVDGKDVEDRSTAGNMKYWQGVCCGWNVWTGRDELYFECEKITHWTPLPELPKE